MRDVEYERIRSRTIDGETSSPYYRVVFSYPEHQWLSTNGPFTDITETLTETTKDTETPAFHALKKRGAIVNNDYENVKVTTEQSLMNFLWRTCDTYNGEDLTGGRITSGWKAGSALSGGNKIPVISNDVNLDYEIDIMLTELLSDIGSAPMQGLVTAAEMGKTVDLVHKGLGQSINALKFLKGLNPTVLKSLTKDQLPKLMKSKRFWKQVPARISQQWLEYRYGYRQLHFDITNAMKAIKRTGKPSRERYTKVKTFTRSADETYWNAHSSNDAWKLEFQANRSKTYEVTVGALVDPVFQDVQAWQAFGLDEYLGAAWELTKFSFVVDWFLNVGEKLQALSPSLSQRVLATWAVVREEDRTLRSYTGNWESERSPLFAHYGKNDLVECDEAWDSVTTSTTTRLADPALNPIPNWDFNLNAAKIGDLLALTRQLLAGVRSDLLRI